MKKKTILSLLTGIAIVASTAGTYAVWDTTQASTSGDVTFRNPVTVTANQTYTLNNSASALNTTPSASGNVTFNVSDSGKLGNTLTIVPEISGGTNATLDDFTITLTNKDNPSDKITGNASSGFVDSQINNTGANNYTVTVTPKNSKTTTGSAVNVKLTATLSKSNTTTSAGTGQGANASGSQNSSSAVSGASGN